MRFDTAASRWPPPQVEHQEARWEMQRVIARKASLNGAAMRRAMVFRKAQNRDETILGSYPLCLEDVTYVSNLAESMGFHMVVHMLDSACLHCLDNEASKRDSERFHAKRALPISSPLFFSEDSLWGPVGARFVKECVSGSLNSELCCGVCLVTFLVNLDNEDSGYLWEKAQVLEDMICYD